MSDSNWQKFDRFLEYKVTAIQAYPVTNPSQWQQMFKRIHEEQLELLDTRRRKDEVL